MKSPKKNGSCGKKVTPQQWFEAAWTGKLNVIKRAVSEGFDVNARETPTRTALCHTVGRPDMLRFLLSHGATLENVRIDGKYTLLAFACRWNDFESVKILVEEGHADVNENPTGRDWNRALHEAEYNRAGDSFEIIRYLLEHGAAVTPEDCSYARTLDELKSYFEHIEVTPEVIKTLLKECAMQAGTVQGRFEKFEYLAGLCPGKIRFTGKFGMELLASVARAGGPGCFHNAFHGRCSMPETGRIMEYLIRRGVDVRADKYHVKPFLSAVGSGNRFAAKFLRNAGADTSCRCDDGRSALHIAADDERLDMVEFLVEVCGLDVDARDNAGKTPAHYAADHNQGIGVLCYLADECGADLTIRDANGELPGAHRKMEVIRGFLDALKP